MGTGKSTAFIHALQVLTGEPVVLVQTSRMLASLSHGSLSSYLSSQGVNERVSLVSGKGALVKNSNYTITTVGHVNKFDSHVVVFD